MAMGLKERGKVGRKKRNVPARTCRLDADLITKCKAMADDAGVDAARWMSDLIRPVVERAWTRHQRKFIGGEDENSVS
jgi:hypothetical protein